MVHQDPKNQSDAAYEIKTIHEVRNKAMRTSTSWEDYTTMKPTRKQSMNIDEIISQTIDAEMHSRSSMEIKIEVRETDFTPKKSEEQQRKQRQSMNNVLESFFE